MTVPKVVYERRGSGPPLVLLHGIGHHWQAWEPVLDRLAAAHEVFAIDLPGFGQSPPLEQPPRRMADLVAGVTEALHSFGLPQPHVAGNSLGGAVALELAVAGEVASATALSPAGFWSVRQSRRALRILRTLRMATSLPEPVLRTMLARAPLRAMAYQMICARPERMTAEVALASARAMRDGPSFMAVARAGLHYAFRGTPEVPVTIAWGTRDRVLSYRQAAAARQLLPRARHVDLTGCGHVPMLDDPDLVAEVILATTTTTTATTPATDAGAGPEPVEGSGPDAG